MLPRQQIWKRQKVLPSYIISNQFPQFRPNSISKQMKVATVQLVSTFQEDRQAVLSSGQRMLELAKDLKARVQTLNVPEIAPPEVPRVMLQRNDLVVALSFSRLDITAQPPTHVAEDFSSALTYAEKLAFPFIEEFVEKQRSYSWTGIVISLEYPMPQQGIPGVTRCEPVFDRLLTVNRENRQLGAFQLQFGFQELGIYSGVTVQGYDVREVEIGKLPGVSIISSTNIQDAKITTSGVEIILDVNNKRADSRGSPTSDIRMLVSKHLDFFSSMPKMLNIEGVLQ